MAPVHEFVPVYVSVIEDADAWPSPVTLAVHAPYGASNPPAGTAIVRRIVEPDTVPVNVPRPVIDVPVTVMVTVPDRSVPVWVTCIVTSPGPEESDAVPFHDPPRLTPDDDGGGDACMGDDDPPPQAVAEPSAASISVQIGPAMRLIGPRTLP